jgi:hypothetical protein
LFILLDFDSQISGIIGASASTLNAIARLRESAEKAAKKGGCFSVWVFGGGVFFRTAKTSQQKKAASAAS